ncbi:MAG: hypothetical protein PHV82_13040 [Victivallaceae bacterium]|nr:hypothetical protein [Victivallaceae bacterium]
MDETDISSGYSLSELPIGQSYAIADNKALRQYRQEIRSLMKEIAEAEANGDNITTEQLQQDLEKLRIAINEMVSPTGQKKKFSDKSKSMTASFRNAVNFTIGKIKIYDKNLAEHLNISIRRGQMPGCYD